MSDDIRRLAIQLAERVKRMGDENMALRNLLMRMLVMPHGNGTDTEFDQLCADILAATSRQPA